MSEGSRKPPLPSSSSSSSSSNSNSNGGSGGASGSGRRSALSPSVSPASSNQRKTFVYGSSSSSSTAGAAAAALSPAAAAQTLSHTHSSSITSPTLPSLSISLSSSSSAPPSVSSTMSPPQSTHSSASASSSTLSTPNGSVRKSRSRQSSLGSSSSSPSTSSTTNSSASHSGTMKPAHKRTSPSPNPRAPSSSSSSLSNGTSSATTTATATSSSSSLAAGTAAAATTGVMAARAGAGGLVKPFVKIPTTATTAASSSSSGGSNTSSHNASSSASTGHSGAHLTTITTTAAAVTPKLSPSLAPYPMPSTPTTPTSTLAGEMEHLTLSALLQRLGSVNDLDRKVAGAVLARRVIGQADSGESQFLREEGVEPLLPLFNSADSGVQLCVAIIFGQLAKKSDVNKRIIATKKVIPHLIALVSSTAAQAKVRTAAASALNALAEIPDIGNQIVDGGGVEALLSLAAADSTEDTLIYAMATLANLTSQPYAQERSVGVDITPVVSGLSSSDVEMQRYAAAVLANFAFQPVLQTRMMEANALDGLVAMADSGAVQSQRQALLTMANMVSMHPSNIRAAVQAGIVPHLVQLLHSADAQVQIRAAAVLSNLGTNPEIRSRLVEGDAVAVLLHHINTSNNDEFVYRCCAALANMGQNLQNKVVMGQAGVVPALLRLIRVASDDVKIVATAALGAVSTGNVDNQTQLLAEGGGETITALCLSPVPDLQRHAARLLATLAVAESNREPLMACGALTAINTLASSTSMEMLQCAAAALAHLSQMDGYRETIVRDGGVNFIMTVLGNPAAGHDAVLYVCWALANLASEGRNKHPILAVTGVEEVLRKLCEGTDLLIQSEVKRALINLSLRVETSVNINSNNNNNNNNNNHGGGAGGAGGAGAGLRRLSSRSRLSSSGSLNALGGVSGSKSNDNIAKLADGDNAASASDPHDNSNNNNGGGKALGSIKEDEENNDRKGRADASNDNNNNNNGGGASGGRDGDDDDNDNGNDDDDDSYEIDWQDIKLGKRIGMGGFGEVYQGWWHEQEVAIKTLLKQEMSDDDLQDFHAEIALMKKLNHPNVLRFIGACTVQPHLAMVTEFIKNGSLTNLLRNDDIDIPFQQMLTWALDAARGMQYLHNLSPPVIHRDLKTENLLVDNSYHLRVADFGISRVKNASHTMTQCGTPKYMAPEVLKNEKYDESCDVYSYGIVLWEILSREEPYGDMHPVVAGMKIAYNNLRPPMPDCECSEFTDLIALCWQSSPHKRPNFTAIIKMLDDIEKLFEDNEDSN